ncbi:MAG: phosphomannomutase/phosphoglucomutase [bacterium]|nr:phosphomannomutase/phosphoglucomutase [bacterium]
MLNPNVFRAYDIRGIVPNEVDADGAYRIGRAYAQFLKDKTGLQNPKIVVQADARPTSPALKDALIKGLLEEGLEIIDGGLATSPMHYFSINHAGVDGGIMITASHIPPPHNGFKVSLKGAINIGTGKGMEELRDLAAHIEPKPALSEPLKVEQRNFEDDYLNFILGKIKGTEIKPLKVVIDPGNGMAGLILSKLLKQLPIEAVPLFFDIDMTFPNHEADPLREENLKDLQNKVREVSADFGIAFDGDADRIGFINETGQMIMADLVATFLAEELFLKNHPGASIVYDIRSSRIVPETIEKNGGRAIKSRTGHFYVKEIMRREKAIFAAERSGHFYYQDFFYAESALLSFLYFLVALSQANQKISEVINRYHKYFSTGEINFNLEDRSQERLEKIAKNFGDAKEINWFDGLSVAYEDWWLNLRPSANDPLLRLTIEGKSPEIVNEKLELLKKLILS